MIKQKISFLTEFRGGEGPVYVYFYDGLNLLDPIEAENELGMGWFSPDGVLLAAMFDIVQKKLDHQVLEFKDQSVELKVRAGKPAVKIIQKSRRRAA